MTTARFRSLRSSPLLGLLVVGVCGASSAVARTAEAAAPAADVAAAQALFDESKKLLASGQFAAARPKLEESERLDASPSTEFYLADCYQHLGQTASAWALFVRVASESKAAGRAEREQLARKRAGDLAPKLSHLVLSVPGGSGSAGLEVKRDGETVGTGQWGTPVPVDPGKHTISAAQPSHVAWSQTVDVPAGGKTVSLEVPLLAPAPVERVAATSPVPVAPPPPSATLVREPEASPAPADADRHDGSTRRTIALVAGGVGVIAVGMGGVFGGLAISKNNESKTDGCTGNECNAAGFATRRTAVSDATISSVLIGAGAAAVVGGVVLWLTAPSSSVSANRGSGAGVAIRLAPNGLFLNGVFE